MQKSYINVRHRREGSATALVGDLHHEAVQVLVSEGERAVLARAEPQAPVECEVVEPKSTLHAALLARGTALEHHQYQLALCTDVAETSRAVAQSTRTGVVHVRQFLVCTSWAII